MPRAVLFSWEGREHEHSPKSADWYWALGIIATASVIACILFGNFLLGILILVAATSIALYTTKHPRLHQFELTTDGLVISGELHHFDRMISFSVLEDIDGKLPPVISIKTENLLAPHLVVPLEGVDVDGVYGTFLQRVDEKAHHHTFADILGALLWF
jgi:hypothetical protein